MAGRLPEWLKVKLGQGDHYKSVRQILKSQGLHTVCASAHCPNLGECWSCGTATFMILGDVCSRNCRFCAVTHGVPSQLDFSEADRIVEAVTRLNLRYVVVTSVTRDDLDDGGSVLFAHVISQLKKNVTGVKVEVLIPDFNGSEQALNTVLSADPDVLNHNIETVARLYPAVRPQAVYERSLELLHRASLKIGSDRTKSGLMVGLGETIDELHETFTDLHHAGTGRLTIGQYLQPSESHLPVSRFVPPDEFSEYESYARDLGFTHIASGPLVRSSYHAHDMKSST